MSKDQCARPILSGIVQVTQFFKKGVEFSTSAVHRYARWTIKFAKPSVFFCVLRVLCTFLFVNLCIKSNWKNWGLTKNIHWRASPNRPVKLFEVRRPLTIMELSGFDFAFLPPQQLWWVEGATVVFIKSPAPGMNTKNWLGELIWDCQRSLNVLRRMFLTVYQGLSVSA